MTRATKSCCSWSEASVQRWPNSRRDISSKSNSSTAVCRISAWRFPCFRCIARPKSDDPHHTEDRRAHELERPVSSDARTRLDVRDPRLREHGWNTERNDSRDGGDGHHPARMPDKAFSTSFKHLHAPWTRGPVRDVSSDHTDQGSPGEGGGLLDLSPIPIKPKTVHGFRRPRSNRHLKWRTLESVRD